MRLLNSVALLAISFPVVVSAQQDVKFYPLGEKVPRNCEALIQISAQSKDLEDVLLEIHRKAKKFGGNAVQALDNCSEHVVGKIILTHCNATVLQCPPIPPKIGDIVDGYKFLGGDPGVEKNWVVSASFGVLYDPEDGTPIYPRSMDDYKSLIKQGALKKWPRQ